MRILYSYYAYGATGNMYAYYAYLYNSNAYNYSKVGYLNAYYAYDDYYNATYGYYAYLYSYYAFLYAQSGYMYAYYSYASTGNGHAYNAFMNSSQGYTLSYYAYSKQRPLLYRYRGRYSECIGSNSGTKPMVLGCYGPGHYDVSERQCVPMFNGQLYSRFAAIAALIHRRQPAINPPIPIKCKMFYLGKVLPTPGTSARFLGRICRTKSMPTVPLT